MARKSRWFANLRVGRRDVAPTAPSHVPGIREGNQPGSIEREVGIHQDPRDRRFATATAERSTGINPRARNPIDPRMPNLQPS
ncbi:hypothetical protein [Anaeromyxobacter oryzae]|uniref:Uncharacterized protein n=1 Tax=Anaeromyxobacter oryzae TaxID=2918170 RepID=A0ABN6MK05_9BACT|nr:hypothetical protein [Anaeromyxobacter oryzae]BDG01374.1 hypothetical protein AMOR_03700 [Anaeromyxobacter oryzae]